MMTRRRSLALLLVLAAWLAAPVAAEPPATAEPPVASHDRCPACGAPTEPGAAFCTRCGRKVGAAPAGPAVQAADRPGARRSVVQLTAVHDKQLTSAFGAIVYGESVEVGSILGSAFAIAPGEFVSDAGLLNGAREVSLRSLDGRGVPARVIGMDPLIGVALLEADLKQVPPLERRRGPLRLGESLNALGFPSGGLAAHELSSSAGVVSGLHRGGQRIHPIEDYIQTDASLPAGFAGGPMIDDAGKLVGMSTALPVGRHMIMGPDIGVRWSIPLEWIERALAWIRAGRPGRPWIGIHTIAADPETRSTYSLPSEVRRVIENVFPGSPAARAGLRRGDGLLKIQGDEDLSTARVHARLLGARPDEAWSIEIARARERLTVPVTLALRPDRPRLEGADLLRFYGGFEIAPRGSSGLMVTRVLPGSEAAAEKVAPGDLLQSLLVKKDLERAERDTARWRQVKDIEGLERLLQSAYSEFDFFIGVRLRARAGEKRELYLGGILSATDAL